MGARDKLNSFYFWIAGGIAFLACLATDSLLVLFLIGGGLLVVFMRSGGIRMEPQPRPRQQLQRHGRKRRK